MKLTRKQIVDVHNALSKFEGKAMSLRCGFALNKAKQAIAGEITALVEAQGKLRLTPELEEYNKAISELDRSDVEKYNEEAKAIYEQHKDAVEEFRSRTPCLTTTLRLRGSTCSWLTTNRTWAWSASRRSL